MKMKSIWPINTVVVALMYAMLASGASAQTYGGSATGASVTVPATGTTIRAASGTLPISGGGAHAGLSIGDIPGSATGGVVSLAAGTMHAAIVGLDATRGEASMANINLTVSGNQITSDFLSARGSRGCHDGDDEGESHAENLVINGQPIVVTGVPNQTVTMPNGTVIINRQTSSVIGTSKELSIDALYVTTTDAITHQQLAEVALASSDSKVDCGGGQQPPETWTTGHGTILGASGQISSFGLAAGLRDNLSPKGHVVYRDPGFSFRMKSTVIDSVTQSGCTTTITGQGQTDTGTVSFTVTATDSASGDSFSIDATGPGAPAPAFAYSAGGPLLSGNIKVHGMSCP
jgi:hypothetical protein